MSTPFHRRSARAVVATAGFALVASPLALMPAASAASDGTNIVISEVYGGGGNSGAVLKSDFIELYNPTDAAISLAGKSVQYRSATGASAPSGVIALTGSIPAHGHYLVGAATGANGEDLPTPDVSGPGVNLSGTNGTVFLANQATALSAPATGSLVNQPNIIDLVGFGTSNTFETKAAAAPANATSVSRGATGADTDDNSADFTVGAPTPQSSGSTGGPVDPPTGESTIAEIQGTGDTSPLLGQSVTTRGVVTASYPTGGFNGFYIQTPGSGGAIDPATHKASDGLFVFMGTAAASAYPATGAYVEVSGLVDEFFGLTQVKAAADGVTPVTDSVTAPAPATVAYPRTDAERESLEGMLVSPQGSYTVTDNYTLNQYAEIGLATGTKVLRQPTDVARPGTPEATAVAADNAARAVTLDDGATTNFLSGANKDIPLPYLTLGQPVRVGAAVSFTKPVVLDFRNSKWKLQPTSQLTADNAATVQPASFENTRTAKPASVGGDFKIASFNVLNYFKETGEDWESDGGTCSYYTDRQNNRVTVNSCNGDGPRGAADQANLKRQQDKIVAAITALGADVVSLEEIENSAKYAGPDRRDDALATLVDALNAEAGPDVWAFAPSPVARPDKNDEDVIRTAFIYKPAAVEPVGASEILTGSAAFSNAREPLAQVFKPAGGTAAQQFAVIVNHFKSKGSGTGADADQNDGQGASNASRVKQATALVDFANQVKQSTGTEQVFLTGDFNAYTQEDPMQVLYDAGYTDIGATKTTESTYLFSGVVGSLDHILGNAAAMKQVTGADVWNINSVESIALEYSRHNYNATNFYEATPFRSSDHDPLVVGVDAFDDDVPLNLLNINDFHGRIDANTTKFATTIEQLRAQTGAENTLFLSAGDNIGASLFASSSQDDNPTLDVLNALGLKTSAVGNHEFDKGFSDLTGHVGGRASWKYLGANVYAAGTTTPALPEFQVFKVGDLSVGVIGAVTEETPTLVTPKGISGLEFGDPVEAVNRVADKLTDGKAGNGEADVIVVEYHEGAGAGTPDHATLEMEVAAGGAFADIVEKTSPKVDAIFTGHTHKQYAWDAPIPGDADRTRPILQTGSYGENVGQITMKIDPTTGEVTSYKAANVARAASADLSYPRVQQVKSIVDEAIAEADVKGRVPVGEVSADITTAFSGGSYVDGKYTGGNRDDRASESTLGNLVADSLRASLADPDRGGAEIGVVNPGGLRQELMYAGVADSDTNKDGVVTFAEANAVLPFLNNLWTVKLTGQQFKDVLEEQFQTNADGTIPSRPFLALGLSENVSTTLDPSKPQGERVTSVYVDGAPLDLDRVYTIGTFSFLATGGDNFRSFTKGVGKDTGLIDRDAWMAYLESHRPLAPSFDRRQVSATDLPAEVKEGDKVSFTLSKLNLTSLGSPENATVEVSLKTASSATSLGSFPVSNGSATVTFTAPAIPAGASIVATALPSGTTVTIPATRTASTPAASKVRARVLQSPVVVRSTRPTVVATVSAGGAPVNAGTVTVLNGRNKLGTATVRNGEARVRLGTFATTGVRTLTVRFNGTATVASSESTLRVAVVKATPRLAVQVGPKKVRAGRTHATVKVTLTAPGQTVTGDVAIRRGGKRVALVHLRKGTATVRLAVFRSTGAKSIVVRYHGSRLAKAVSKRVTIRVVR